LNKKSTTFAHKHKRVIQTLLLSCIGLSLSACNVEQDITNDGIDIEQRYLLQADRLHQAGQFNPALEQASKALFINPQSLAARSAQAKTLVETGKAQEALDILAHHNWLENGDSYAHAYLDAYLVLGGYQKLEQFNQRFPKHELSHPELHRYYAAAAFANQGRYSDALKQFKQLYIDFGKAWYLNHVVSLQIVLGQITGAETTLQTALEVSQNNSELLLSKTLVSLNRSNEALIYDHLIAKYHANYFEQQKFMRKIKTLIIQQKNDEAKNLLSEIVFEAPKTFTLYDMLAKLHYLRGEYALSHTELLNNKNLTTTN